MKGGASLAIQHTHAVAGGVAVVELGPTRLRDGGEKCADGGGRDTPKCEECCGWGEGAAGDYGLQYVIIERK